MKKLVLIIIALFATPSAVSAQTLRASDVAVWVTDSELNDPSFDEDDGTVDFELDEEPGFGISVNHFWLGSFSTELAYHRLGADVEVTVGTFHAGEVDASALTGIAQWHFRREARFSPYVGAGAAYMTGDFEAADEEDAAEFEDELTWAANFGADIGLTEHLALGLDAKYINWEPRAEGDEASERVDLTPLVLSAGLRLRF